MDKGGRKRGKLFCDRRRRRSHKKVPTGRNVCLPLPWAHSPVRDETNCSDRRLVQRIHWDNNELSLLELEAPCLSKCLLP